MTHSPTREQLRYLDRENAKWPKSLAMIPEDEWPEYSRRMTNTPIEVWRSRDFLVQVFDESPGSIRMSVNRTDFDRASGRWSENITWDDLQRLKREIGRGHLDAVEIYPADRDVVNVANMRHLWILQDPFPLAWRRT